MCYYMFIHFIYLLYLNIKMWPIFLFPAGPHTQWSSDAQVGAGTQRTVHQHFLVAHNDNVPTCVKSVVMTVRLYLLQMCVLFWSHIDLVLEPEPDPYTVWSSNAGLGLYREMETTDWCSQRKREKWCRFKRGGRQILIWYRFLLNKMNYKQQLVRESTFHSLYNQITIQVLNFFFY